MEPKHNKTDFFKRLRRAMPELLLFLGSAAVTSGVVIFSLSLGLIVGGGFLITAALYMLRGEAA